MILVSSTAATAKAVDDPSKLSRGMSAVLVTGIVIDSVMMSSNLLYRFN